MTTAREVPLQNFNQQFTISLAGVQYTLLVYWSPASVAWVMDMLDGTGQVPILRGVALVTANNLLDQFDYLDFGGKLYVQTDHDPQAVPTFDNLGTLSHLYFVTEP